MASVQTDEQITKTKHATAKLNKVIIDRSRFSTDITFLASPVTGGGVAVNRFEQLFLLAIIEGRKQPQEWAKVAWEILASQNQLIIKNGKSCVQQVTSTPHDSFARK
jgi:hypothetical protein